jgi:hypothetical protein
MASFIVDNLSSSRGWPTLAAVTLGAISLVLVWRRYSQLWDVPGPFLASITRLWHIHRVVVGDQNLKLIELHKKHGHFVRVAPNEVSVSHPDGIKKVLVAPLPKVHPQDSHNSFLGIALANSSKGYWYKALKFPDWRWENPMAELDPKKKIERSKNFASAYAMGNLLKSEGPVDEVITKLCDWMNQYADSKKPMDLVRHSRT